jgi:hypothetical protein
MKILYLDGTGDTRHARKALSRYGDVCFAPEIGSALHLLLEEDFQYFCVDADTDKAQAFIHHLDHDPELEEPLGVFLLTGNEREDCEAWGVDAFVHRDRLKEELPYVFSHPRRNPETRARVFPIEGGDQPRSCETNEAARRLQAFQPRSHQDEPGESGGSGADSERQESRTRRGHDRPSAPSNESVRELHRMNKNGSGPGRADARFGRSRAWRPAMLAAAVAAVAVCLWALTAGPLGSNQGESTKSGSAGMVEAESAPRFESVPVPGTAEESNQERAGRVNPEAPAEDAGDAAVEAPPELPEARNSNREASPPETAQDTGSRSQENSPPSVRINGPAQVLAKSTATYTAYASDPDGDGVSYSWGAPSITRCWSAPGLYTVTVTATDARGASASASISVRVI